MVTTGTGPGKSSGDSGFSLHQWLGIRSDS